MIAERRENAASLELQDEDLEVSKTRCAVRALRFLRRAKSEGLAFPALRS